MTIFDCDDAGENEKTRFLSLLSMVKSSRTFSLEKHEMILDSHPSLREVWVNHRNFIESLFQRLCQIADFNFHGIFSGSQQKTPKLTLSEMQQPVGSGALIFGALINHSCSGNVTRVWFNGKVAYVACRTIPAGAQLFDCYK